MTENIFDDAYRSGAVFEANKIGNKMFLSNLAKCGVSFKVSTCPSFKHDDDVYAWSRSFDDGRAFVRRILPQQAAWCGQKGSFDTPPHGVTTRAGG